MLNRIKIVFIISLIGFSSCAPSRFVKPLEKGEKALNVNLGGPLIGFAGTTIPIPFTSVTGAYGVKEKMTAFSSLHTTSLAFGVFQAEMGLVKQLNNQKLWLPAFSLSPVANLAFDRWEYNFRFWPQLDANAFWEYKGGQWLTYAGVSNWFDLSAKKAHGETQNTNWIYNFQLGQTLSRGKWNYSLELKYLAPFQNRLPNVVDYKGFGEKGAVGLYLSFTRKF